MAQRVVRSPAWLVLLSILLSNLALFAPAVAATIVAATPAFADPQPAPEPPRAVAAEPTPSSPVIALSVDPASSAVPIGDTTTISVTVSNRGVVDADAVTLTLPVPDGVAPTGTTPPPSNQVWQWNLGPLPAQASVVQAVTVRVTGAARGDAIRFEPSATSSPTSPDVVPISAGFVAVQRGLGAAEARFNPGSAARLVSLDTAVTLDLPPGLFARPLQVRHRSLLDARDDLTQRGIPLPPEFVGAHRAFPAFVLDATDNAGRDVHQFDEPLTLSVAYTPAQLQALGIREEDLQLYWFDEATRTWEGLPTTIDFHGHAVSAPVDHFTSYTLSDGSSPSAAYLPSLQGWQVSTFTGAASYSYPIALPAGPGGLAPQLSLSYSSAATDGSGGTRPLSQSSWVGKGWSLDGIGYVATNENTGSSGHTWDSYTMVMGGQSLDLVKGKRLDGAVTQTAYQDYSLDKWYWHGTDDNYTRVSAIAAPDGSGWYAWRAWSKDGTRYEFDKVLRWGENANNTYWTYKWLLTKIVDTHGNAIVFDYVVDSLVNTQTIHPTYYLQSIRWAFDGVTPGSGTARYRVLFGAADRQSGTTVGVDANWEYTLTRVNGENGTPHEKYRLDDITVQSMPPGATAYSQVRRYHLTYASSANSVQTDVTAGQKTLTLLNVEQFDRNDATIQDATKPSPTPFRTTFTYGMSQGSALEPTPGWNRLLTIDNGRGGKLTFAYEHVWLSAATPNNSDSYTAYYQNYYRVNTVKAEDLSGTGKVALTDYDYGAVANATVNDTTHAVSVYYAMNPPAGLPDSTAYLNRAPRKEFRGHGTVIERTYDGPTTGSPLLREVQRWFYQGNANSTGAPAATCTPALLVDGSVNTADDCFIWMRRHEGWKGRAYKEETRNGSSVLTRTQHTFSRTDLPYFGSSTNDAAFSSYYQRVGLWRAFNPETQTEAFTIEGSGPSKSRKTVYCYVYNCSGTTYQSAEYGNLTRKAEYDQSGNVIRRTEYYYVTTDTANDFIVDRVRQEVVSDAAGNLKALTNRFYDNTTNAATNPTDGDLRRESVYYDVPNSIPNNTTLNGVDTVYTYDAYGNRTEVITYAGYGTRTKDSAGAVTWSSPGNGSATSKTITTYDSTFHAFSIQVQNAASQIEKAEYDYVMGTLIKVIGPNSQSDTTALNYNCTTATTAVPDREMTCARYDGFGRLVTLIKPSDTPASPTVQATYFDTARPFRYLVEQKSTASVGGDSLRQSEQFYDGLGRKLQTKAESGDATTQSIVTDWRYDALGRVVAQSQPRYVAETAASFAALTTQPTPLSRQTSFTYDALDRPLNVTAPDSTVTKTRYWIGSTGPAIGMYDANDHLTAQEFDTLGRLRWVYEYSGTAANSYGTASTTTYSYDILDRLTQVSDAASNQTTLTYDTIGRKTGMTDPDMGQWSYTYDPDGNLTGQRDAKLQWLCYYYDALNRPTAKHQNGTTACPATQPTTPTATYSYDAGTNGKGHRTSMAVSGGASTSWTYDVRGRVVTTSQTASSVTLSYTQGYDTADRLTSIAFPAAGGLAAETVTTSYDAGWRSATLCSNISGQACYVGSATYTALDQPDVWKLNGTTGSFITRDAAYTTTMARLSSLSVTAGATTLLSRSYGYDNVGNITSLNDTTPSSPLGSQTLTYDHRDRLLTWVSTLGSESYSYSAIGNLATKAGKTYSYAAQAATCAAGALSKPHAVTNDGTTAYCYDANGNMVSGGGRTYSWTPENLPASITVGTATETYTYDGDNERVTRTAGGATTVYLNGILEQTGTALTRAYTFNGQMVARRTSTDVRYVHSDHLGSVAASSAADGTSLTRQYFDPWGKVRSGGITTTSFNFTSQRLDATGLLYYHARMYDPALGRFVSADTLIPDGSPQSLNRYTYVHNNPLKFTDPSGHCSFDSVTGEINKWDCTVEEFDAMSIADRLRWVEQFMRQSGCECFHNIAGVLDFFMAEGLGASGTWFSMVDAAILQGISLGYGNYLSTTKGTPAMTNTNWGAGAWTDFFARRAQGAGLTEQRQLWGDAEQKSTDYGVWYAEHGINSKTGKPYGLKPNVREKSLITITDAYRVMVKEGWGDQISFFDPFNPDVRWMVKSLAVGFWETTEPTTGW